MSTQERQSDSAKNQRPTYPLEGGRQVATVTERGTVVIRPSPNGHKVAELFPERATVGTTYVTLKGCKTTLWLDTHAAAKDLAAHVNHAVAAGD